MLPDFIIAGASRSGTTSLYYYLSEHPQIFMPKQKELRFFDKDSNYLKGKQYYGRFFADSEKTKGEASPPYFYEGITFGKDLKYKFNIEDDAPLRIKKMIPQYKNYIVFKTSGYQALFTVLEKCNGRKGRKP